MRYRRVVQSAQCILSLCPSLPPHFDFSCLHCTVKDPAASEGALPLTTERRKVENLSVSIPNIPIPLKCKRFDIFPIFKTKFLVEIVI